MNIEQEAKRTLEQIGYEEGYAAAVADVAKFIEGQAWFHKDTERGWWEHCSELAGKIKSGEWKEKAKT